MIRNDGVRVRRPQGSSCGDVAVACWQANVWIRFANCQTQLVSAEYLISALLLSWCVLC